ncbi:MAG: sensor histidine kinase, partial [Rhodothermaceae bacterium]
EWQGLEIFVICLEMVCVLILLAEPGIILSARNYFALIINIQSICNVPHFSHQKELLNAVIESQENEKNRIAAELHDDLVSDLNVILLLHRTTQDSESVDRLLSNAINKARNISHQLNPPLLDYTDLPELIDNYITPLAQSFELNTFHKTHSDYEIPVSVKLNLFRIIQELFSNIIKHSNANKISVWYRQTNNHIAVRVTDNGIGFTDSHCRSQAGLKNIESRMQYLNGVFKFKTAPGKGCCFIMLINSAIIRKSDEKNKNCNC